MDNKNNEKLTLNEGMISESFRRYLPFKDRTYCVRGYIGMVDEYEENRGYVDNETGNIYICSKDKPPVHLDVPILFVNKKTGEVKKKDVSNSKTDELFNEKNMYDLSYQKIHDTTTGDEELYDEEALADMNAASALYVPVINEDEDDPLKKIIKTIIITKQIDINRLKSKMTKKYALSNMKSALNGRTKMSIANFNIWCEILGVNYDIIISDNGSDTIDPLEGDLHFSSQTNKLQSLEKAKKIR